MSYDEREVPFDLAVVVPVHNGAPYVTRSEGLGDALGFVPTDEHTLQSTASPHVFAIGDAAAVPTSKAGSVTHFEGEVRSPRTSGASWPGEPLDASYDGHANCFIETGFSKAMLIDFNYDTEPLPGHFPSGVGPAADEGVPPQPPREAALPVVLLAQPAARPGHPGRAQRHADAGQGPRDSPTAHLPRR